MSTTGPFDTGYIGAHRWHVEQPRGTYVYTCICGDTGRVSGNLSFLWASFARHAHRKLEEAALTMLLELYPLNRDTIEDLERESVSYRQQDENDLSNLHMLLANRIGDHLTGGGE